MNVRRTVTRRPLPSLESDEDARRFVDDEDLTRYDLSRSRMMKLAFGSKADLSDSGLPDSRFRGSGSSFEGRDRLFRRGLREAIQRVLK
ncbi:MAG: hypothetical protein MnENMB40S_23000 [Rhizobiaceae bacterium MnEN-MB40S]|nr:MAG: hypothetical protein MnENMB40S_23000 [Rhizobiaceae bacterium MnEN-MB40S]